MELQIGADPELFAGVGGNPVSAYGLIPGTKNKPHPVERGAVQVDGMALEFNIDPAKDSQTFLGNIKAVLSQLKELVPDYNLIVEPVAEFGLEYISSQPSEAVALGCDPDFNAYTGEVNPDPEVATPFRTAAGHIHLGFTEDASLECQDHLSMCQQLVKELDISLGLASILFDRDNRRRELYGKAGAFRPKSYGCEYRVLSNKWLSSDALIEWVFRAADETVNRLKSGRSLSQKYPDIESVINSGDTGRAFDILCAENLEVPDAAFSG